MKKVLLRKVSLLVVLVLLLMPFQFSQATLLPDSILILPPYKLNFTRENFVPINLPGSNSTKLLSFNILGKAVLPIPIKKLTINVSHYLSAGAPNGIFCSLRDGNIGNKTYATALIPKDKVLAGEISSFKINFTNFGTFPNSSLTLQPNIPTKLNLFCDTTMAIAVGDAIAASIQSPEDVSFVMYGTEVYGTDKSTNLSAPLLGPSLSNP